MIRCAVVLNINGQWEGRQLFPSLQLIIKKYRENFAAPPADMEQYMEGKAIETEYPRVGM